MILVCLKEFELLPHGAKAEDVILICIQSSCTQRQSK